MDTNTMTDTTGNGAAKLRIPIAPGITLELMVGAGEQLQLPPSIKGVML